jgi:hypothetical protein
MFGDKAETAVWRQNLPGNLRSVNHRKAMLARY